MEFNTFRATVIELKECKPIWFGLQSDPPASDSEIHAAELSLGVAFPCSYRHFVREFGGGYFAFGNVFSVTPESEWNIVDRNEFAAISGFICVSDNGTGDYYGFKVVDRICKERVYVWDHEDSKSLRPTEFADLLEFLSATALAPS